MSTRPAHKREQRCHRGRHRCARPKTFRSEDKAKSWAQKEGIKNFEIVRLRSGLSNKVKVVSKK
ncbi:MAG: hypothetical protein AABW88_04905 [Nanoarchaeota archaeon]|mgnify:CR=1 FL=1